MAFLELAGLRKSFGAAAAVEDFTLAVEQGEFVSLLGPSGCGKTTVLRMVAGFEHPTAGVVRIAGEDVTALPARRRRIGMVFQSYALFPNLTVAGNIAFGLKVARLPRADTLSRIEEMLRLIELPQLAGRYPSQLSGGQQQRVALARALAIRPRILLLDEPLSALDAKIRLTLREDLRAIQRRLGITAIFVTHDQEEALAVSHRVVVMREGRIEQVGTPAEIYRAPATAFVATFVGTANVLPCRVVNAVHGAVALAESVLTAAQPLAGRAPGETVRFALRPEAIATAPFDGATNSLPATVEEVTFLGAVVRLRVGLPGRIAALVDLHGEAGSHFPAPGAVLQVWFRSDSLRELKDGKPAAVRSG